MLYQWYSNLIFLSPPVLPIRYPFSCSLHSFSIKYTHFTKLLQWYHFLPHSPLPISPKTYLPPILVFSSFVPKRFSFTIPLFHPISTTFRTLFAQNSAFLYTQFSLYSPYTFLPLKNNTCISLFSPKNFYQTHWSLLTISLSPSTSCPSHPILPFSFLSFHPSFIFYSLVFLLSLL